MKTFIASVAFATLIAAAPALALDGSEPGDSALLERQELAVARSAQAPARFDVRTAPRASVATSISGFASSDEIVNSLANAESDYQ